MKELFVPHNLEQEARRLGINMLYIENQYGEKQAGVLYQQITDWFITKGVFMEIYCNHSGYGYILTKTNGTVIKEIEDDIFFNSNYEAMDEAIEQAFKLI